MDGAQQIVIPAFVTLLCLCIVFVPMFQLGGVAGYLFRPLAEAVVFALVGSFLLSRTLVPTMANYLMRGHHAGHDPAALPRRSRNPLKRFQQMFDDRFAQVRARYRSLLSLALASPKIFIAGFLACVVVSFGLWPFLGENFFPAVDSGQILMHVRAQPGTRIEETARLFDLIEQTVRQTIPPDQLDNIVDNIGLPFSGINMAYQNTGTIGPEDGDALISLKRGSRSDRRVHQAAAHASCRRSFPARPSRSCRPTSSRRSSISACRRRSTCRSSATIRRPTMPMPRTCSSASARFPASPMLRIQQVFNYPQINVDVDRTLAGEVGLTQRDVANSLLVTLVGQHPGSPEFLVEHRRTASPTRSSRRCRNTGSTRCRTSSTCRSPRRQMQDAAISGRAGADHPGAEPGRRLALQRAAGHRHFRRRPGARSRRRRRRHRSHPAARPARTCRAAPMSCCAARFTP